MPAVAALDLLERLIRPWRFMPGPASTLPVAVILNRFLTDDLVFILGIWVSFGGACQLAGGRQACRGRACPTGPARRQGRGYNGGGLSAREPPRSKEGGTGIGGGVSG